MFQMFQMVRKMRVNIEYSGWSLYSNKNYCPEFKFT